MTNSSERANDAQDEGGKNAAFLFDVMVKCGYDMNEVHPECYRHFSYIKLRKMLAPSPQHPEAVDRASVVEALRSARPFVHAMYASAVTRDEQAQSKSSLDKIDAALRSLSTQQDKKVAG